MILAANAAVGVITETNAEKALEVLSLNKALLLCLILLFQILFDMFFFFAHVMRYYVRL
jgi:hypothetical protein